MQPHFTDHRVFIFKWGACLIKSSASLWCLELPSDAMLLSSHLFVLQVTGAGYAQSPWPCTMVKPPPWTRAWSPFRTTDSSSHRATFSWHSPTNSDTASDLRSVTTSWCYHFPSPPFIHANMSIRTLNITFHVVASNKKTWQHRELKRFWCEKYIKNKAFYGNECMRDIFLSLMWWPVYRDCCKSWRFCSKYDPTPRSVKYIRSLMRWPRAVLDF